MPQVFFNARELFSTPGYAPYYEPDKITNLGSVNREMIHAGFWRAYAELRISGLKLLVAPKLDRLAGAGALNVAATTV